MNPDPFASTAIAGQTFGTQANGGVFLFEDVSNAYFMEFYSNTAWESYGFMLRVNISDVPVVDDPDAI